MEQAAEQLTDNLVSAIKSQKTFYTLQDLRQNGYPGFIVERIRLTVYDRFLNDFTAERSPWINPDDEKVKQSLLAYKQAAFNACVIPQEELYAVTKNVVGGIINVLLRPRAELAAYIYRGQHTLTYEEMLDRTSRLTVHRHFAQAIPKYMQKRGLSDLAIERCATLIQKLDANLTAAYSPKEWAESLELLFTLYNGEVDARLLDIYFEDKNNHSAKNAVAGINGSITKEALVQILSAPEDDSTNVISPENNETTPTIPTTEEAEEEDEDKNSLNAMFREQQNIKTISDNFEEEASPSVGIQAEDSAKQLNPLHKNLSSVLDIAAESFRSLAGEYEEGEDDDDDELEQGKTAKPESHKEVGDEHKADAEPLKTEIPQTEQEHEVEPAQETHDPLIWQQFLTDEHRDIITGKSATRKTEDEIVFLDEGDIIDETPLFEHAQIPPKASAKEELNVYLMGQEVFYIEELFNGSEKDYQQSLSKIDDFTGWNDASEYIFQHIFATHHIDLSSEAAVDFIDRLQAYFTEFKN